MLEKFKGGYFRTLQYLFPEIGLDINKFYDSPRHWKREENRRNFFINYATDQGFNFRDPEKWYKQSAEHIMSVRGAKGVMSYHNGIISQAIFDLFPDIHFDPQLFQNQSIWSSSIKRKQHFEEYAKENGFDPLIPENWYSQSLIKILSFKNAKEVLSYHNKSTTRALINLFPNIGLEKAKFNHWYPWRDANNRRRFFEQYAVDNNFDLLNPRNWYSQPLEKVISAKGAGGVIYYHNNSVTKALIDLFPNIGLEKSKFLANVPMEKKVKQVKWSDEKERRKFFLDFASAYSFDPLDPENWYNHYSHISSLKDTQNIIYHHDNSIINALVALFPDIGLQKSKFNAWYAWRVPERRRKFFEDYAKRNSFDPLLPVNWYNSDTISNIMATKGVKGVLYYYNKSVSKALINLFPEINLDPSKIRYSHLRQ